MFSAGNFAAQRFNLTFLSVFVLLLFNFLGDICFASGSVFFATSSLLSAIGEEGGLTIFLTGLTTFLIILGAPPIMLSFHHRMGFLPLTVQLVYRLHQVVV